MDLHHIEQRMDQQDNKLECLQEKIDSLEKKLDVVMEQVTLGRHMITFAKMIGWLIGVTATILEVYRRLKGQ